MRLMNTQLDQKSCSAFQRNKEWSVFIILWGKFGESHSYKENLPFEIGKIIDLMENYKLFFTINLYCRYNWTKEISGL